MAEPEEEGRSSPPPQRPTRGPFPTSPPPSSQQEKPDSIRTDTPTYKERGNPRRVVPVKISRDWVDKTALVLGALTLLMLTAYTLYSRHQWLALEATLTVARDQVAAAREANRLASKAIDQTSALLAEENRAWVAPRDSRLELVVGKRPSIVTALANSGKTPALKVIFRGG